MSSNHYSLEKWKLKPQQDSISTIIRDKTIINGREVVEEQESLWLEM